MFSCKIDRNYASTDANALSIEDTLAPQELIATLWFLDQGVLEDTPSEAPRERYLEEEGKINKMLRGKRKLKERVRDLKKIIIEWSKIHYSKHFFFFLAFD